jgi:hypothetical protein
MLVCSSSFRGRTCIHCYKWNYHRCRWKKQNKLESERGRAQREYRREQTNYSIESHKGPPHGDVHDVSGLTEEKHVLDWIRGVLRGDPKGA